ncbi:MAG TPA: hypothetical protein VI854_04180 [Acidimicrobiia bacterium]|nr:hypothetical protein [Acidimicrobiia bacterium]
MNTTRRGNWYDTPFGRLVAREEQASTPRRATVAETMQDLMRDRI